MIERAALAIYLQSFHMILGQLPLRAKPSHVEAEPGGSRGTVVIVRTRVGFGVSLVGGGARVQVFERSICAQNGHFWRLSGRPRVPCFSFSKTTQKACVNPSGLVDYSSRHRV